MKKIDQLHTKAMQIAQRAYLAQMSRNETEFVKLSKEAFNLEKEAAMLLHDKYDTEPNRSILFKSAAFLAFDAKEYNECLEMIISALFGKPDTIIKNELQELYEDLSRVTKPITMKKSVEYALEEIY